jgi:hypothetical protein
MILPLGLCFLPKNGRHRPGVSPPCAVERSREGFGSAGSRGERQNGQDRRRKFRDRRASTQMPEQ